MTIMQKISLYLAKRYLKVHHCRMRGSFYLDDNSLKVFAVGDVLFSPVAFASFLEGCQAPEKFYWEASEVCARDGFLGAGVPVVHVTEDEHAGK